MVVEFSKKVAKAVTVVKDCVSECQTAGHILTRSHGVSAFVRKITSRIFFLLYSIYV